MLKSFAVTVDVDPNLHPKIIGRKGAVISKIRIEHKVNIQFPERDSENQSTITITGYEKSANEAKEDILRIVREYVSCSVLPRKERLCLHQIMWFRSIKEAYFYTHWRWCDF